MLADEMGFPFVSISQGSDAHQYLGNHIRRKAITTALRRSNGVITRSAEIARLLAGVGVETGKLLTIYNGVDLNVFQPGDQQEARTALSLPAHAPIVLFVGNFYPVKDPLLLIRSHRRLRADGSDARLLMIGGGELETQIRREAQAGVDLLGRRSSGDIARYMQAADILCVPSRNEGVPNVILEAFASGLRVVATRVGGISEVLTNGDLGTLVPPGDEKSLSIGIAELLKRQANVGRVRAHALQFSWSSTATSYRRMLEESSQGCREPKVERIAAPDCSP